MNQNTYRNVAWLIFVISTSLAIFAWGQTVSWDFGSLSPYQWFPLFGIMAWMIMWGHYVVGTLRILNPDLKKVTAYSKVTAWIVLGCLLLHPGILAIEQNQNGQGLPPESYINYVGESLQLAVMLGTISLIIFLSFEFFDRMKNNKTVQKYSTAISISQSLAMIMIFVHGMSLGTSLGEGWFRAVWALYGLALIPCFYVIHKADFSK